MSAVVAVGLIGGAWWLARSADESVASVATSPVERSTTSAAPTETAESSATTDAAHPTVAYAGGQLPALDDPESDAAVGMPMPSFGGPGLDGVSLDVLPDGRPKVILFLAHWCPHCQAEVPALVSFLNTNGWPTEVDLVAIATSNSSSRPNHPAGEWLDTEGWTLPTVLDDDDNTIATAFGLSAFPFYVVVDSDGQVLMRLVGQQAPEDLGVLAAALIGTSTVYPVVEQSSVTLQLPWVAQSQFAGYYAALDQGYYTDEGLDVTILEGGVAIVPQQVVESGGAEFAVASALKALASNEIGASLVNVAQIFERSGTRMISWSDSEIRSPSDWEGKVLGNWGFGNEYELTAAIDRFGVDPAALIQQAFTMDQLLDRSIDAAQAMSYHDYAILLETIDPTTGELYGVSDFTVIDFNDPSISTATLQDGLWVTEQFAAENPATIEAFIRATLRGWIYCREEPESCVDIVLATGSGSLGRSHQLWQMNEVNRLIWPSVRGIGVMRAELWDQTAAVAVGQGGLSALPGVSAYTSEFAEAALAHLAADGLDIMGSSWAPHEVTLAEGGE